MRRPHDAHPASHALTRSVVGLLASAREQSHALAERRAGQLFPLALPAEATPRRRRTAWAALLAPARPAWAVVSLTVVLLLGGGATWALVQRAATERAMVPAGASSRPTLGEALGAAGRAVGPARLARRSAPRAAGEAMVLAERAVVARSRPAAVAVSQAGSPASAPAAAARAANPATSVVLDAPEETVIIVTPPAKHGPLWTPQDFGRYMRRRLGRSE